MTSRDIVERFVAARCVVETGAESLPATLYAAFQEWATGRATGKASRVTARMFAHALTQLDHRVGRRLKDGPRVRAGIRPMTAAEIPVEAPAVEDDPCVARWQLPAGRLVSSPFGITALSRVGVAFTEDQKALIKSLVEAGDVPSSEATPGEPVLAADLPEIPLPSSGGATGGPHGVVTFPEILPDPTPTSAPPPDLSEPAREWWESVNAEFQLNTHQQMILTFAAQAWEEGQQAARELREAGSLVYESLQGPKARPEVAIKDRAAKRFALLTRELGLHLTDGQKDVPRGPRAQPAKEKR